MERPVRGMLLDDRYLRKAEVQGLRKRGAQHVRKGQALDLSPTDKSDRGTEDWRVVSTPFQFSSRSGRQRDVGGNLAVASSALGWRQRMGRGSVGGDCISRKGSSAASLPDCDRKFERVTPTSRTPFGGGNTDRIRSRAISCSPGLVWIADSIDRLRLDNWNSTHLILTVTVSQTPVPANGDTHPSKHLRGPVCSRRHL